MHLHLSPLSAEDVQFLQTQSSRPRNRYTAQQAHARQWPTTVQYSEESVLFAHGSALRHGQSEQRQYAEEEPQVPSYGYNNPPITPTRRLAGSSKSSAFLETPNSSRSVQKSSITPTESRYLQPQHDLRPLPDPGHLSPSPSPHRTKGIRTSGARQADAQEEPGIASSWTWPTKYGAYSSTPDSRRTRRVSRRHSYAHRPGHMTASDGDARAMHSEVEETTSTEEEEEPRSTDGEESSGSQAAWDAETSDDDASSISSNEIVDMPPPRSARTSKTITSPYCTQRSSSWRQRRCSSSSRMAASNDEENACGRTGVISAAMTDSGADVQSDASAAATNDQGLVFDDDVPSLETRLEKALRLRWMRNIEDGGGRRGISCQTTHSGRSREQEQAASEMGSYGTFA